VARVVVTETARADLRELIATRGLPPSAAERVRNAIRPLAEFPLLGSALGDAWKGYRFVLGPWPWMLIVYVYDDAIDQVAIVTIQDGRSAQAATSARRATRGT
jgi:plasmid stabilization system protein ParE